MILDALAQLFCQEIQHKLTNLRLMAESRHNALRRLELLSEAIGLTQAFVTVFSRANQDAYTSIINLRLLDILEGLSDWRLSGFRENIIFMGV